MEFIKENNSIEDRINLTYEDCNKTRATVEFSCFVTAPDYIYRIAEVILEITGQIELRTPFNEAPSDATPESRKERWEVMRECFKNPYVILNMYDRFDTTKLTDGHFMLLEKLERDH